MEIELRRGEIRVDGTVSISVQRAQRVGRPLDAHGVSSLGLAPLHRVLDHPALPGRVVRRGGFFVALGRDESFWLGISAERPHAIRVRLGELDAISGETWCPGLGEPTINYVVAPPPQFVYGIRQADGSVRQFEFTTSPLGIEVFAPVPSASPRERPRSPAGRPIVQHAARPPGDRARAETSNDLGAGPARWDGTRPEDITISLVDPDEYAAATGDRLPPPVSRDDQYVPRLLP